MKNLKQRAKARMSNSAVSRWKLSSKVKSNIAYVMIGSAVIASYFLTPIPVAIGLTILALIRFWIIRREEKKEEKNAATV